MGGDEPQGLWAIHVDGLVQGVGFRPYVWRLATEMGLAGTVRNSPAGVDILLAAPPSDRDIFIERLRTEQPPLARIDAVAVVSAPSGAIAPSGFAILESASGAVSTGIVPDAALCPQCRREISDPADRRFAYPFANCTHCGPRLSIVESIPYDRGATTMRKFPMCAACRAEYENPADRRYHAEPIACAACGPTIWSETREGPGRRAADALAETVERLRAGQIVAIKGIGGFHLACLATDAAATTLLRQRKRRDAKPFALMAANLAAIERHCDVTREEADYLQSAAAPIVLLTRRPDSSIAANVAPGHNRLGFMLPYSPLHALLFEALGDAVLVMTSANSSGEPQVIDNAAARETLFAIADAILFHDRDIANRVDDSVLRLDRTGPALIRRARGFAPAPLALPAGFEKAAPVLALGGDLKGAFAFAAAGKATLSQHLGDLDELHTLREFERTLGLYRAMFGLAPRLVAVDAHPGYRSSALGRRLARAVGADIVEVQHHHAHLAACLAENGVGLDAGESLGVILDGLGWGPDGTVWGGEFLAGDYRRFKRIAWFMPVALPGGDAASREPWRNALAHLRAAFGNGVDPGDSALAPAFAGRSTALVDTMIARGVNAPLSSSAGRLFDAAAALLGLCAARQDYEGQAAMEMEAQAEAVFGVERAWAGMPAVAGGAIDWAPLWRALLADLRSGVEPARIASRFHRSLIAIVAETAGRIARERGIGKIALSGGVFQNRLLLEGVAVALGDRGFTVLTHRRVPANDGGLALGQAAIASAGPADA